MSVTVAETVERVVINGESVTVRDEITPAVVTVDGAAVTVSQVVQTVPVSGDSVTVRDEVIANVFTVFEGGGAVAVELGWFNIHDYGASHLSADNTAAINAAIAACGAAGGGIVWFPPVPAGQRYRLATNPVSVNWALQVYHDNVHLRGAGAASRVVGDLGVEVGVIGFQGSAKPTGLYPLQADSQYQRYTVYPVTAPSAGAGSLTLTTLAHAANFAVGDYIYLRSGETIASIPELDQPEATINRVSAKSGAVLSLAWPLPQAFTQQYHASATAATTLASGATAGNVVINVTSGAGFSVNDYVTVKGAAGEPDHVSQVESRISNAITLMQAPQYAIASGAVVHNGVGFTSTTSTAYPSAFGVAPVSDTTISNCSMAGLLIESLSTNAGVVRIDQIVGFEYDHCLFKTFGPCVLGNKHAWVNGHHNRFDQTPGTLTDKAWAYGPGSGSDFIEFCNNRVHSTGHSGVVIVESTQHVLVNDNIFAVNTKQNEDYVVAVETRSGRISIQDNNFVQNGPGACIYSDTTITHGGIVQGNIMDGVFDNDYSVLLQGDGWTYGTNSTVAGVLLNATVGKTTKGVSTMDAVTDGVEYLCQFTLEDDISSFQSVSIYLEGSAGATGSLKGIVYADGAGAPGALLGTTPETVVAISQPEGWVKLTFASPFVGPTSGPIWVGFHVGPTTAKIKVAADSVTDATTYLTRAYASGPLNPFGTPTGKLALRYSVYATYQVTR